MMNQLQAKEVAADSLPFPLKNAGRLKSTDPEDLLSLDLIGTGSGRNKSGVMRPSADFAIGNIGEISMVATRMTPCTSVVEDEQKITLAMLYAGDTYRYLKDGSIQRIAQGDVHLCQRTGGTAHIGLFSGIICEIDRLRLERTMKAMGVEEFKWNPQSSYVISSRRAGAGCNAQRHLWSLMSFVDELLGESSYLAGGLGLDDQLYRLLALALFQEEGIFERIQKYWEVSSRQWKNPLDELVDYIRSNAHRNLALLDLEEQSHYSARHLQNLFKEKFDCSPMQFVRKHRLSAAMEKLQTAGHQDTITNIARDCGYAYTSSFSTDFHREFGVTPSVVLRASRGAII